MVPGNHAPVAVEHHDAVSHIVKGDTESGTAAFKFARPLLDKLLEALGRLLALLEEPLEFDRVSAEDLDGLAHCCDLVRSLRENAGIELASSDGQHALAEPRQAAHDIAAHIQPDDEDRRQEAQRDGRDEDACAHALNRERIPGRIADVQLGCGGQIVDRRGKLRRQRGILLQTPLPLVDEGDFTLPGFRDGIGAFHELTQPRDLFDEKRLQFRVQSRRGRLQFAQASAELEGEHREAAVLIGGGGLGQHADSGGEQTIDGLGRPLHVQQQRQVARRAQAGCRTARNRLSDPCEETGDLTVGHHQPGRQQALRLVVRLKHAAEKCFHFVVRVEAS